MAASSFFMCLLSLLAVIALPALFDFQPLFARAGAVQQAIEISDFKSECTAAVQNSGDMLLNTFISTAFIEQVDEQTNYPVGPKDPESSVCKDRDTGLKELKQMYEDITGIAIIPAPDPDPELKRRRIAHFLSFNAQAVIHGNPDSISQTVSNNLSRFTQYNKGNSALIKQ